MSNFVKIRVFEFMKSLIKYVQYASEQMIPKLNLSAK